MPKIVFNYFDAKGLGEGIRMLLAYGGEGFEDNRFTKENWPEYKPKTPFGQMPVLEIDGKQYSQSMAILRYLGQRYNLAGSDIEEKFEIDQNVDFINDLRTKASSIHFEADPELKAKKYEQFIKDMYPTFTDKLDEIIKKNNGYLAAGKLTWGDFFFAGHYDTVRTLFKAENIDEKYPSFKKLYDTVLSLPKVKEYIAASQKT